MKRLGMLTFFTILFLGVSFGLSTNAHAASEADIEKALEIIDAANAEMDHIIETGVQDADNLWAIYLEELEGMKNELANLDQQIAEVELSLTNSTEATQQEELNELLAVLQLEKASLVERMDERTARFDQEVDEIISYVFDITLQMTQDTIDEVAEYGVIAECYWKYVRFADRWAWIDPVRVVAT
jgi:malonyl CoA-acyl carrier protein transacylase